MEIKCIIDMTKVYALVANGKGGVGKSFFSQILIEYWTYRGLLPYVAQVDSQARLQELNQLDVLTIPSKPELLRADPSEQLGRFRDITNRLITGDPGQPFVLDIGANEEGNVSHWMGHSEFSEELRDLGRQPVVFIVYTAEQEAIEKAGQTARSFQKVLPDAHFVFVENRRFGAVSKLHPGSSAKKAFDQWVAPLEQKASKLVMPAVLGQSYSRFEASRTRFLEVIGLSPEEIMSRTGLERADARIARGDVGVWVRAMLKSFDELFGQEPLV